VPTLLDEPSKTVSPVARYSVPKLTLDNIAQFIDDLVLTERVHAEHEEHLMFAGVREWYPMTSKADEQHEHHLTMISDLHQRINQIKLLHAQQKEKAGAAISLDTEPTVTSTSAADNVAPQVVVEIKADDVKTSKGDDHPPAVVVTTQPAAEVVSPLDQLIKDLQAEVAHIQKEIIAHLKEEESNIVWRKWFSGQQCREILRTAFLSVPIHQWSRIIPFILNNQYSHMRRVRALQSLRDVVPDRIQLIGKIVYEGCNELMYQRLLVDIPQMAPRATVGYHRTW